MVLTESAGFKMAHVVSLINQFFTSYFVYFSDL
jgi:hypothetical protein